MRKKCHWGTNRPKIRFGEIRQKLQIRLAAAGIFQSKPSAECATAPTAPLFPRPRPPESEAPGHGASNTPQPALSNALPSRNAKIAILANSGLHRPSLEIERIRFPASGARPAGIRLPGKDSAARFNPGKGARSANAGEAA